jgi:hypothetical protein
MNKQQITEVPAFYKGYIDKAADLPLLEALIQSLKELQSLPLEQWQLLHQRAYFPGKWTLNELLQHIIDTERIMSYRALAIARGEMQSLPGFDENQYAATSDANERSIAAIFGEWIRLRQSTIDLFESFSDNMLMNVGTANANQICVLALGFIIVGHEQHHLDVVRSLYLPML